MPEPTNIDLTALAAEQARARHTGALPVGQRGVDVLVIDDQPDHEAGWFDRHLAGHRRLSVESVGQLERFLAGETMPNMPSPPHRPELAIVDLNLGAGQRDGLQALHLLRSHPATCDLPAILNTNGLEDHRDLLCVLAAQVNGGAIAVAQKTTTDGPAVRDLTRRIAHANDAELPWPLTKEVPGLVHAREVMWHGDRTAPESLLRLLLDLPWKRTYWKEMTRHRNHQEAAFEARKRHGNLAGRLAQGELTKVEKQQAAQNHARFVANLFGPVAVAWQLAGGRLYRLDGRLGLATAELHHDYAEFSGNRRAHLGTFAALYGPVLCSPFVQSLLDEPRRAPTPALP